MIQFFFSAVRIKKLTFKSLGKTVAIFCNALTIPELKELISFLISNFPQLFPELQKSFGACIKACHCFSVKIMFSRAIWFAFTTDKFI